MNTVNDVVQAWVDNENKGRTRKGLWVWAISVPVFVLVLLYIAFLVYIAFLALKGWNLSGSVLESGILFMLAAYNIIFYETTDDNKLGLILIMIFAVATLLNGLLEYFGTYVVFNNDELPESLLNALAISEISTHMKRRISETLHEGGRISLREIIAFENAIKFNAVSKITQTDS